jgi:hypothetical protein
MRFCGAHERVWMDGWIECKKCLGGVRNGFCALGGHFHRFLKTPAFQTSKQ